MEEAFPGGLPEAGAADHTLQGHAADGDEGDLQSRSGVLETTCVLLDSCLLQGQSLPGGRCGRPVYAGLLAGLQDKAFMLVAGRAVSMDRAQAEDFLRIAGSATASDEQQVARLTAGLNLVLAYTRDNAVSCAPMLLGDLAQPGLHFPATVGTARQLLRFFFPDIQL